MNVPISQVTKKCVEETARARQTMVNPGATLLSLLYQIFIHSAYITTEHLPHARRCTKSWRKRQMTPTGPCLLEASTPVGETNTSRNPLPGQTGRRREVQGPQEPTSGGLSSGDQGGCPWGVAFQLSLKEQEE